MLGSRKKASVHLIMTHHNLLLKLTVPEKLPPPPTPPPKEHDLNLLSAKLDASSAARDYGHSDGDQDGHISPDLVRDFISMPGTDARSLLPPPYYEDAGINPKRWKTQRGTQRGDSPAPSQPPTGPLPVKPPRRQKPVVLIPDKLFMAGPLRRISGQADLRTHVPATPEGTHSVPKTAVSMSRHTGPSTPSMPPIPTSSSWSAGPPAASRKIAKDEEIKQFNDQLDDLIEYFSTASESSSDEGKEREERGMWYE